MMFFFFKQKTAYEMRISDWSSDVCSSDLQSSTLLEQFCRKKGRLNQTLSSLFQAKNITLAQSGGMQTTIRLVKNGRQLGQALTSNLHVKDGDGTTPHAAPRIYFQHLDKDEQFRLFLLYVGPHSDHVIDKDYEWTHS